jgi:Sulfatase
VTVDLDETPATASTPPAGPASPRPASWLRRELGPALELGALGAFVVTRPVLASFGDAPDVFIAEMARRVDIVAFAVLVAFGPLLAALLGGSVARLAAPRLRRRAHLVAVGGLAWLAVWQLADMLTPLPIAGLAALGLLGGVGIAVWRARTSAVGTFLRYAAVAAVVFAAQFAFASPASSLIWESEAVAADPEAVAAVDASLGDDAPPVVMVVLDELPTATLLDGDGRIDADLFPNFARLAADGTWYRNHTTVAGRTPDALSAILTGRYPDPEAAPTAATVPDNLFTLLADTYDLHVREQLTAFCPRARCEDAVSRRTQVPALVADGVALWGRYMVRGGAPGIPTRTDDRLDELNDWIADQDFGGGGRPGLHVVHTVLPHSGWEYLPDGTRYRSDPHPTGATPDHTWTDRGTIVGRQRHVMQTQAVDRSLGTLIERLESAGAYDDAVVVVTADHGGAFVPGEPRRGATEAQYEQIAWTPLIIKAPHQAAGVVSDDNVQNIDILPTVFDLIGVDDVPEVDGHSVAGGTAARDDEKWLVPFPMTTLEPSGEHGRLRLDAEEGLRRVLRSDAVPGEGPRAVWQLLPGRPLVGTAVADLRVGDEARATVDPGFDDAFDDLDVDALLPLQIDTTATVEPGTPLVVAVNGVVAGSTLADGGGDPAHVQVMVEPGALTEGDNDVRLYVVGGGRNAEVLHPVRPR